MLSLLVFNVCVEEHVLRFKRYVIGCHGSRCYSCLFVYADEITLLVQSL